MIQTYRYFQEEIQQQILLFFIFGLICTSLSQTTGMLMRSLLMLIMYQLLIMDELDDMIFNPFKEMVDQPLNSYHRFDFNWIDSEEDSQKNQLAGRGSLDLSDCFQQLPSTNEYRQLTPAPVKTKEKEESDYSKNICGYITKKIMREFICKQNKDLAKSICTLADCEYESTIEFYRHSSLCNMGPRSMSLYVLLNNKNSQSNQSNLSKIKESQKLAFTTFYLWFLRQRYPRLLLLEGKMRSRHKYIEYKNRVLLSMIESGSQAYKILDLISDQPQ